MWKWFRILTATSSPEVRRSIVVIKGRLLVALFIQILITVTLLKTNPSAMSALATVGPGPYMSSRIPYRAG